ncbi:unnamed protein product [Didymodactylos carnosus]|uniref:Uncharacterized protein n=1 Tax=Didymodactylos carnosus TaxID=1234261 RepID=A0A8S2HDD1_9BILA|nr:unnamed protein product [Didymodactylos carnosus]CAF3623250.1 unnamed protein product [Didymodactylos carnosus]
MNNSYRLHFAGFTLSASYHIELLHQLKNKDFAILIASKSGTTLETKVTMETFVDQLTKKHVGVELNKRIIAVTDPEKGELLQLAKKQD